MWKVEFENHQAETEAERLINDGSLSRRPQSYHGVDPPGVFAGAGFNSQGQAVGRSPAGTGMEGLPIFRFLQQRPDHLPDRGEGGQSTD